MNVIIYHDDNDGRCAAAITLKKLKQEEDPLAVVLVPAVYNKAGEISDGVGENDDVFIVDFSFPLELMRHIVKKAKSVTWIDHHKSAVDAISKSELSDLPGARDTKIAACLIAWKYFFPDEPVPRAVQYIADRDAWIWEFGLRTAQFHYGLSLDNTDPRSPNWLALLQPTGSVSHIVADGAVVLKALGQRFRELRDAVAFETEVDGHSVRAMNVAIAGSAAFGAAGWETGALPNDVEICCQYYYNGEVFTVSLYSPKGGVDVSEICKKRGGGGHANAAGFTAEELPDFLRKSS